MMREQVYGSAGPRCRAAQASAARCPATLEHRALRHSGLNPAPAHLKPASTTRHPPAIDLAGLAKVQETFADDGVAISVIEPVPPMEGVKQGLPERDVELARRADLITGMGTLGIPVLYYNVMTVFGWLRTDLAVTGRGGSTVTGFTLVDFESSGEPETRLTEQRLWSNYQYFLDTVLPVAENAGVILALHPDDPPVLSLRGVGRIMRNPEHIATAMGLSDSPSHKLTFCQGTFTEMGVDILATIRRFADKIAFVHFRDVRGDATNCVETFQDEVRRKQ